MANILLMQITSSNKTSINLYANIKKQFDNENKNFITNVHADPLTLNAEVFKMVSDNDIFIYLISPEFLASDIWKAEFATVTSLVLYDQEKLLIPLTIDEKISKDYFDELKIVEYLPLEANSEQYQEDIDWIINRIDSYLRKTYAKNMIDSSAKTYIEKTRQELDRRAKKLKNQAYLFFISGYFLLSLCLIVEYYYGVYLLSAKLDWTRPYQPAYIFLSNVIMLTLFISLSKYLFSLGKSIISEHLRMADRSHALSFGEFYLAAYSHAITPTDFKEVFRDWNINNQNNNFSSLNANDFDPQLLGKISGIVEASKKAAKEK